MNPFAPSREERRSRRTEPVETPGFRTGIGRFLVRSRWVLAGLYALCVLALYAAPIAYAISENDPSVSLVYVPLLIGLGLQVLFCYARGDAATLQPVTFKGNWLPLIIGGLLGAILAFGAACALGELLYVDELKQWGGILALMFFGSWLLWAVLFSVVVMNLSRLAALRRILLWLIAGSMLQLITTISSHVLVMRRGGCLVGMQTSFGVACGAAVCFWAFGPGVMLLFLYEMRNRRGGHCLGCGYSLRGLTVMRCPECGRAFTLREVNMSAADFENPH